MVRRRLTPGVASRARRLGRREWSSRIEKASLERDGPGNVAALAAFTRLDRGTQMRLAMEVAETRQPELTLAYENVVMVLAGFKRVSPRRRRREWDRSPCVTFVVRRKWPSGRRHRADPQHLPACLLAYVDSEAKRVLCAVPTDVMDEVEFFGARAHQPSGIRARAATAGEVGNVGCAVGLRDETGSHLMLMTCHHVLSPQRSVGQPEPDPGAAILTFDTQVGIGNALPLGGRLHADETTTSFDVQFGHVENIDALRSAVRGLRLSATRKYLLNIDQFRALPPTTRYLILASPYNNTGAAGGPLPAEFASYIGNKAILQYTFRNGASTVNRLVKHELLLMFRILGGAATLGGDSGSAIVCAAPDGMTLVAMHIGGGGSQGTPCSLAIPSWMLFNPYNYELSPGAVLAPVNVP